MENLFFARQKVDIENNTGGGGGEYTSGVVTLREKCRSLFSPSQDFRPLHHHFKSKDSDPSPDFSSLSPGQRPLSSMSSLAINEHAGRHDIAT